MVLLLRLRLHVNREQVWCSTSAVVCAFGAWSASHSFAVSQFTADGFAYRCIEGRGSFVGEQVWSSASKTPTVSKCVAPTMTIPMVSLTFPTASKCGAQVPGYRMLFGGVTR